MARKKKNRIKPENTAAAAMQRLHKMLPAKRHDSSSELCLIVDGMNIAYMAYHAYKWASHKGKNTSILLGMPSILKTILGLYRAKKVIVCWDGKKHPERLRMLPGYKSHRDKERTDKAKRKAFLAQIKETRKLLHALGVTQLHSSDVEGDDMMYFATDYYSKLYRIIIVSGDKDMLQLINWDINVYNPRSKEIHAPFAFSARGVELHQWVDYLCLVGDTSDDIPGYRGIGEVRACNFLRMFGSIKNYLEDEDAEFNGINDKEALRKLYKRNRRLIDLKLFARKYYTEPRSKLLKYYKDKQAPEFDAFNYHKMCGDNNLKTISTLTFLNYFTL